MSNSREFEVCHQFFKEKDNNGSTNWTILSFKMEINYYYKGTNLDLNETLCKLNSILKKFSLEYSSWKRPFAMCLTKPTLWVTDFSGTIIFNTTKEEKTK